MSIKKDPAGGLDNSARCWAGTDVAEQQGAFAILAATTRRPMPMRWWRRGSTAWPPAKAPPELALDVLEAAAGEQVERIKRRLAGYEGRPPEGRPGAVPRGPGRRGRAEVGRQLFFTKAAAECQRCHKLDGQGGEVGPPLNGVGKQTREYLLESLVLPSKAIAKGYESVLITTLDGKTVSGVLKSEDDKEVRLMTAEGKPVAVKKAGVRRKPGDQVGDQDNFANLAKWKTPRRRVPEWVEGEVKKLTSPSGLPMPTDGVSTWPFRRRLPQGAGGDAGCRTDGYSRPEPHR